MRPNLPAASLVVAVLGTVILVACTAREMPGPDEGAQVYDANCSVCHGASGKGDGALAGDLPSAPVDLTRIAARNGGTFPIAKTLSMIDGYARGAHDGRVMPEFGAVLGSDTVPVDVNGILTPTPRPLAALLEYLESIQQP